MLGVGDPERTRRAAAIDLAGEQLVIEASADRGLRPEPVTELAAAVRDIAQQGSMSGKLREPQDGQLAVTRLHQPDRQPE
jgi:hypothetical protein